MFITINLTPHWIAAIRTANSTSPADDGRCHRRRGWNSLTRLKQALWKSVEETCGCQGGVRGQETQSSDFNGRKVRDVTLMNGNGDHFTAPLCAPEWSGSGTRLLRRQQEGDARQF